MPVADRHTDRQNDAQVAFTPRVVVVQDSGQRQIVVNVLQKDSNSKDSLTTPKSNASNSNGGSSSSANGNNNDPKSARRHSLGSKPPSYTKITQPEEVELLPTYRDATSYREAIRRAQSDGLIINFIDE